MKKFKSGMTWKIGNFPAARFVGRKPTIIEDSVYRDKLFLLGVFDKVGDKGLRYKGEIVFADKVTGSKVYVDMNGEMCIDKECKIKAKAEDIPAKHFAKIDKEFEEETNV